MKARAHAIPQAEIAAFALREDELRNLGDVNRIKDGLWGRVGHVGSLVSSAKSGRGWLQKSIGQNDDSVFATIEAIDPVTSPVGKKTAEFQALEFIKLLRDVTRFSLSRLA